MGHGGRWAFGILGALAVVAVIVRLTFGPDLKGYRVPSGSMQPTVKTGDRTVVDRGHRVRAVNFWVAGRRRASALFGDLGGTLSPFPFAVFPSS